MQLKKYIEKSELFLKTELEKVALLAYFHLKKNQINEFGRETITSWFNEISLPIPNLTRLETNMIKSRSFIKGSTIKLFRLHANELSRLEKEFPELNQKSEEIVCNNLVIPESLYLKTRGFIENIAKQVNASYEFNIFDGCAVLMRRLLEILLILSYEKLGISNSIKDVSGNYLLLEGIVNDAKTNSILNLSRNAKSCLDQFRILGNFSAHKIHYNCRREDINKVILEFRAIFEELLYKSGIRI